MAGCGTEDRKVLSIPNPFAIPRCSTESQEKPEECPAFPAVSESRSEGCLTPLGTNSLFCADRGGHQGSSEVLLPRLRSAQRSLGLVLKKCKYPVKNNRITEYSE